MAKAEHTGYDVIIIGAGIGGLVCGCYLAKAGMKVLIVEQHHRPGGYCASFKRKGFTFDAAPHCFGGYREAGMTRKIFNELAVDKKLTVIRPDPTDIIITPEHQIPLWNSLDRTIFEIQANFPQEGDNARRFFYSLLDTDPQSFSRMRSMTFHDMLNQYFGSDKLKTILAIPLFAISGLPPTSMSAFVGAKLYSEFLIDGGYYPRGGMQALSDTLAERFREMGGDLRMSCLVKKIRVKDHVATGIVTDRADAISSKYIVSNCDARQTFFKLLGKEKVDTLFYENMKTMVPSMSNYIVYLGVDKELKPPHNPGTMHYYFPHYDLSKAYAAAQQGDRDGSSGYALRISHDRSTINAILIAPYKNKTYWTNKKYVYLESLIAAIEKKSIPGLTKHIIYKEAATPHTLYRYTLNYHGASYGWAGLPSQFALRDFRKPSFIQNLYLAGHWTTLGVGISGTAYIGYDTAKMILRKEIK